MRQNIPRYRPATSSYLEDFVLLWTFVLLSIFKAPYFSFFFQELYRVHTDKLPAVEAITCPRRTEVFGEEFGSTGIGWFAISPFGNALASMARLVRVDGGECALVHAHPIHNLPVLHRFCPTGQKRHTRAAHHDNVPVEEETSAICQEATWSNWNDGDVLWDGCHQKLTRRKMTWGNRL